LVTVAMHGSEDDFYDLLSRELWFATSKLTIEVVGFESTVGDVAKFRNIPHEAVVFNVKVEACDRTGTKIASHVVLRR
jgi:hypothetical protein